MSCPDCERIKARDAAFVAKNPNLFRRDEYAWSRSAWLMPRRKLHELLDHWRNKRDPAQYERRLLHLHRKIAALRDANSRLRKYARDWNAVIIDAQRAEIVELRERLAEAGRKP